MQRVSEVGSWIECINPFNNPVKHFFKRHIPGDKRFDENDKAKICPVCWFEAKRRNGTLIQAPRGNKTPKLQATPEKDSL
jgi:hypothetical protein